MTNIHAPERQADESQEQYRERRKSSHQAVKTVLRGTLLRRHIGHSRRQGVKAAGGIRQFKRARYLAQYEGYAAKHPGIAR